MKNKRICAALLVSALALSLLSGCGKTETPPAQTPPAAAAPAEKPSEKPAEAPAAQDVLAQLTAVPGMADGEVAALLGDGTASYAEDKSLVGREYAREVFGDSAAVSVGYGDGKSADGVTVNFAKLPFADAQTALQKLYGAPSAATKNENTGGQTATWNPEGLELNLVEAYGAVSLLIVRPAA